MTYPRHRMVVLLVIATSAIAAIAWWRIVMPDTASMPNQQPSNSITPSPTLSYLYPEQVPVITLDQILNATPATDLDRLDPERLRTFVVTGDIIPARGVDAKIRQHGPDYPLAGTGITELLQSGDLTIANLESPLLSNCPIHNEGFTFCGQSAFAQAMADAGIDVATLENNHIGNYGQSGISETISHLQMASIDHATSNRLLIKDINGLKVGVLAFTGVGGSFYPNLIKQQIEDARPKVDLLFVAFHWGKEYELIPTADPKIAPDNPRIIAQEAIRAGADFIIGNHPHWVQGVELIEGKLVNYAYGNFIFDQSWSQETLQGYVGVYTFYGLKLVKVEMHPIEIRFQAQPNLTTTNDQLILERIKQSSHALADSPLN